MYVDDPDDPLYPGCTLVTYDMADRWRDAWFHADPLTRPPIDYGRIVDLFHDIVGDQWEPRLMNIVFDRDGFLLDGITEIMAIASSGQPQWCLVETRTL